MHLFKYPVNQAGNCWGTRDGRQTQSVWARLEDCTLIKAENGPWAEAAFFVPDLDSLRVLSSVTELGY